MNRKLLNGLLVLAVAAGGVGTFTSCKDEDFRNDLALEQQGLQGQLNALRNLSDQAFMDGLQEWLDNQTISKLWQYVLEGPDGENYDILEPYIQGLYDIFYNKIFPTEQWFLDIANLGTRPSSVEVSHVYSTVFGTVNLPLDIKSNILATYKYLSSYNDGAEIDFPAGLSSANFAYGYDAATISNIKALNPTAESLEGVLFSDPVEFGNMGGAVVTVNPANIDATKYTVKLVNSLGDEFLAGGLTLKPYKGTEALAFGVNGGTRAGVQTNDGVYGLYAEASEDNADDLMIEFDKSNIKDAFKNWMNNKTNLSNIAGLGKTLIDAINNKVPAYALQLSWQEKEVVNGADGTKSTQLVWNNYQTGFDYAAVVARPLSYNVASEIAGYVPSDKHLPHIGPLSEYLEKISNKLNIEFEHAEGVEAVTIYLVVKNGVLYFYSSEDAYNAGDDPIGMGQYTADGLSLTDAELETLANFLITNYNDQVVNSDVIEKINESIDKINSALDDVQNQLASVQSDINDLANSSKLKYAQKIVDWYNLAADRINDILDNPAKYFMNLALYDANDGGVHRLSTLSYDPISFKGSQFNVYLTSYNAELIVPAFKKYVAVTAVTGADGSAKSVEGWNTGDNLNKVLAGYENAAQVVVPSSAANGDVITISYLTIDYHGYCSMQNYYVRILK